MARVTLNPIIKSLSGRIGSVVYYHYWNRQYIRRYVVPRNPNTPAQRERRGRFADAVKAWQGLEEYKKGQWNGRALRLCMSGYNLYISARMKKTADSETVEPAQEGTTFASPSLLIRTHSVLGSVSVGIGRYPPDT